MSKPLNVPQSRSLCENIGAEHTKLLLYTEVCWLSRRRVLKRLLELNLKTFMSEHGSPHSALFTDTDWPAKLCYLADIFSELNVCVLGQGHQHLNDKVGGFLKKS